MTTHHWQTGPAKCRNPEYFDCSIVGFTPSGCPCGYTKDKHNGLELGIVWHLDGTAPGWRSNSADLIPPEPPKLTRGEVARQCLRMFYGGENPGWQYDIPKIKFALDHYDKLRAEGRIA